MLSLLRCASTSRINLDLVARRHLSQLLRDQGTKWLKKPFCGRVLWKTARVGGVVISFSLPLFRISRCRAISNGELSRRAEHLSEEFLHGNEPDLSFSDIWKVLKPYVGWLLAAVVSAIFAALLNIYVPVLLGDLVNVMVDFLSEQARTGKAAVVHLKPIAVKLIFAYAAQAVMTFLYITFLSIMGERMANDLRIMLFERLLFQDMSFYDVQRTGELNARLSADVQEFKSCFKLAVAQGLRTFAQVGGCMVSMFMMSPKMTLFAVTIMPMVVLIGTAFGAVLREISRAAQAQSAIACAVADEAFANIRTVRSFAMEDQEIKLFRREVNDATRLNEFLGVGIGIFQGATNFFLNGVVLAVLYGGSSLISTHQLDPGSLMSFLATAQIIQRSLGQFSVVFGQAVKGWTAGARIFELINLTPAVPLKGGLKIPFHSLAGEIRFEDVSFEYPSRPGHKVFDGLNLTIEPGQVLALCGPSGEGKSTLAALLERFYEPTKGRITLDGKDITFLDPSWLRGSVLGLISQEPVLFATTIEENIRYGKPEASDEEVREAASLASADGFIREFPDGYKTVLGERGVTLSGGQKQRIAIARALLKNPPVLILDEATSALDAESEKLVQDALGRAMRGRTVIVIAHRLSTIQNADSIAVVKNRRIMEKGNHKELMKKKGLYYELVKDSVS